MPRKLAVQATATNVKQIEQERGALLKKEAKEKGTAEEQAGKMKSLRLTFTRKVGEHGILYGSVTSMDIAEALKESGYEIDRRRITLRDAIKEIGDFTVPVRLHREVMVEIPVEIVAEGGAKAESKTAPATKQAGDESAGATAETETETATEATAEEAEGAANNS